MEIAKIEVSGVHARRMTRSPGRWEIPAGLVGGTISLRYGAEWAGLQKTVVFDGCGVTKDVVNAAEVVTVPAEVVARPERKLLVGIYGVGDDGTATPTLWLEGYVCAAADPSGDPSTAPSLPVWAQLESRIRALEERFSQCTVIWSLVHVSCKNPVEYVELRANFSTELIVEEGFQLDSVTVRMGGVDITSAAWDGEKITVGAVTGDLEIRAEAVLKQTEFVSYGYTSKSGSALNRSGAVVTATANWICSDFIPAAPGQDFRYFGDTSAYGEYASVWGYDANGKPAAMLADNGSHTAGVEFTVPEGVYGLRLCAHASGAQGLEVREDRAEWAGEAVFTAGIVVSGTGEETAKTGGGATGYLTVKQGDTVVLYNILPNNGGRIVFYDAGKKFLEATTIYTQGGNQAVMVSPDVIPAGAAYVRLSTNVLDTVRGAVIGGG